MAPGPFFALADHATTRVAPTCRASSSRCRRSGTRLPEKAETSGAPQGQLAALDVLHAYYRDLNSGDLQANRYFARQVTRYITMRSTSTAAIDRYIRNVFPKQFKEHHFTLEEGTLTAEGPRTFTYVEKASYYFVAR